MASKATPISQLQSAQSQFTNTNDTIVNDILQEIESTNNQSNNDMSSQQVQYQMDPSTQQPHQVMQQPQQQQQQQQQQHIPNEQPHMIQQQQPPLTMHNSQFQENMSHYMNESPSDMNGYHQFIEKPTPETFSLEMILDESKLPLVVALLVVVFNLKQLDSSVIKFIPKALGEDGNITTIGLLIKGLVAGVLFYLAKKFI